MHRSRLAARAAIHLAVEFGHHARNVAALGEVERVPAIRAEQHVTLVEMVAHSRRYRFLSDTEMDGALDLVRGVKADDLLFDPADQVHRAIKSGGGVVDSLFHLLSQKCPQMSRPDA